MNWHDVLHINGIDVPVVPQAGALVAHCGAWGVLYDTEGYDLEDAFSGDTPAPIECLGLGIPDHVCFNIAEECAPVLIAVPDGLTCWDVLAACWYTPDLPKHYLKYRLKAGVIIAVRYDDETIKLRWQLRSDAPQMVYFDKLDIAITDLQKCRAIYEWIKANEVKE